MINTHYILTKTGKVRPIKDVRKWAKWFESAGLKRLVGDTNVLESGVRVSTVFLGLDHNFGLEGKPILFETMIFGSDKKIFKEYQERYCTPEEAEKGHRAAVRFVKKVFKFKQDHEKKITK